MQISIEAPVPEGAVNCFIIADDPVTLIDTGFPGEQSMQAIKEALQKMGLQLRDIQQIVITHMHIDHFGGVMAIQQESDADIYVHEQAVYTLEGGWSEFHRKEAFFRRYLEECGAENVVRGGGSFTEQKWRKVHYIKEGDQIRIGGRDFQVVYTPGHSQTDICVWDPLAGHTFGGDFLLENISPGAIIAAPNPTEPERPKPLLQLLDSYQKALELPFGTIYPGHGAPFREHREIIHKRIARQNERIDEILRILKPEPQTACEIAATLYRNLNFLALSQVQGYLDLLMKHGQVAAESDGSRTRYRPMQ